MTLRALTFVARLFAVAKHHAEPPPRTSEQAASIQLYPSRGRDVQAVPKSDPRAVGAAEGLTHKEQ